MASSVDRSEIAFFDLETTIPTRPGEAHAILEFGSILVCPERLIELDSFDTLVRPHDRSLISDSFVRSNGITADAVFSAPSFSDIADRVYDILHGRVWAGHNILRFDCVRLREAYAQINRPPPEPKGTIDSLALLTQRFGRRAGDMKMDSLAAYFELGEQRHRSLADVRMNFEVVKCCATVLFLESINPREQIQFPVESDNAIPYNEVSMASITIVSVSPYFHRFHKIQIHHKDIPLQIRCDSMRIRFGLSTKYLDHAGRPRLSFVVDANSPNLCDLLDACDNITKRFIGFDCNSEWRPLVNRMFYDSPTIRLNLRTEHGDSRGWMTEIYQKESSSSSSSSLSIPQLVSNSSYDVAELDWLFCPGGFVDANLCLEPYNYPGNAGIRLVAKKLIVHY
ncbi:unnamed protein product [Lactuca saligna]|uniref:Exonuclease domain-containing protein n=1 Tax=Lactuca saligna TaxID=75948 RepID=A0AA35YWQ4_LACSI|nr:unnamed protein product [Lactuca saligna]